MKIKQTMKKCIICGKESEQLDLLSYSNFKAADFDLKPADDESIAGTEIQECPHCHYCNFDIEKAIENRYQNENIDKLKLWKQDEEIQAIIKNTNGLERKYLIMAEQFSNKLDFESLFNIYIKLSWLFEGEKGDTYRMAAATTYINHILPKVRTGIMQMADILRMSKEFEVAGELNRAAEALLNEAENNYEFLKKVVKQEEYFIKAEDSTRHNLSEIN